jgi:hypothetical protein
MIRSPRDTQAGILKIRRDIMPKTRFTYIIVLATTTLILLLSNKVINDISFRKKQLDLAERLGVSLVEDYYPTSTFPKNYFLSVLNQEMTRSEVHKIVVEYEQVYTCGKLGELYYYYSKDEANAIRFEIRYDFDGKFRELMGEDNSSRLYDKDCIPGPLDE